MLDKRQRNDKKQTALKPISIINSKLRLIQERVQFYTE